MLSKYRYLGFIFIAGLILAGCAATTPTKNTGSGTFVFDVPENRFRVIIPDLPHIEMHAHPLASSGAHFRFMGGDKKDGYSISILTPTADKGMKPEHCANAGYASLLKRYGLNEKYVFRRKNNSSTYIVLFPHRAGPLIQLKAYLLSGYDGDHCIDVHISKNLLAPSEEEVKEKLLAWYQGFTQSSIDHY
ncbi:MAG: hypothetical protein OEZ39_00835 [Gammaproteobacteria bacterium]|nr:hypothetical protein [Gammaproteobacteria bacterium]MDH5650395.1 hypothetical protein [Gammaproteobacteria bacterium]